MCDFGVRYSWMVNTPPGVCYFASSVVHDTWLGSLALQVPECVMSQRWCKKTARVKSNLDCLCVLELVELYGIVCLHHAIETSPEFVVG